MRRRRVVWLRDGRWNNLLKPKEELGGAGCLGVHPPPSRGSKDRDVEIAAAETHTGLEGQRRPAIEPDAEGGFVTHRRILVTEGLRTPERRQRLGVRSGQRLPVQDAGIGSVWPHGKSGGGVRPGFATQRKDLNTITARQVDRASANTVRKGGAGYRTPLLRRKPTEDEQGGQHCPDHPGALFHRGSLKMPMATKAGQVIGSFRGGSDPSLACRPTNQAGFILNTGEAGTFFQKDSRKGRADCRDL